MQIGIIGLQSSGKTTVFNALTGQSAATGDYSLSKDANRAVVKVPDRRLDRLAEIFKPKKIVHAEVQYTDIAGMAGGMSESRQEAAYVAAIRKMDAIMQVVRVFADEKVPAPQGSVDPVRDINDANSELVFNDLVLADNNITKLEKQLRVGKTAESAKMLELLRRCRAALEDEIFLADIDLKPDELKLISGYCFLTLKPQLYILNIGEEQIDGYEASEEIESRLKPKRCSSAVALCAQIAMEISRLDDEDKEEFRAGLGIETPAVDTVITESYRLLGLISFMTGGDAEARAWAIKDGTTALEAAGVVHSDFQRGFIKAEIVTFEDLDRLGSWNEAKHRGKLRLEGKEYVVRDGDVILFRFNV
jgi:GTP-binding protein YchF